MSRVHFADGTAKQRLGAVSGHVQLHRHGLVLDQRSDTAEQIKTFLQRRAHFRPTATSDPMAAQMARSIRSANSMRHQHALTAVYQSSPARPAPPRPEI